MKKYILNYNHLVYKFSRTQLTSTSQASQSFTLSNTWPIIVNLMDFKIITCRASYPIKSILNISVTKQALIIKESVKVVPWLGLKRVYKVITGLTFNTSVRCKWV